MHILKPIYSLLLDIYWRINRDYKSPQKSITGLFSVRLVFCCCFFKEHSTGDRMVMITVQLSTRQVLPQQVSWSFSESFAATELLKVQIL